MRLSQLQHHLFTVALLMAVSACAKSKFGGASPGQSDSGSSQVTSSSTLPANTTAQSPASVMGKILDCRNQPVPNTNVTLSSTKQVSNDWRTREAEGQSDSDGKFALDPDASIFGEQVLEISDARNTLGEYWFSSLSDIDSLIVYQCSGDDVAAAPSPTLGLNVVVIDDSTGLPVPNAEVTVRADSTNGYAGTLPPRKTDLTGKFTLESYEMQGLIKIRSGSHLAIYLPWPGTYSASQLVVIRI